MQTIVAPTGLPASSLNPVSYAADLAGAIATNFSLIYVCTIPMWYQHRHFKRLEHSHVPVLVIHE